VWIEGHYTTFDSDYGDGDFGVAYVGADYLVNDNLLVGLLAQFDWTSMEENGDDVDGFGWMIGPYMSAEIVPNVFFDARFAWGQSDNDVTVDLSGIPFSGDFDTDRWLAQAALYGNFTSGNWRLTPEVSVAYIEEKRKSFSVTDNAGLTNTTVGSETLSLGRLTAGPEVAYRFDYGSLVFEPQLAVNLIWDFHAQGDEISGVPVYDTDPRGAVELGFGIQADNGWAARFGAKYDGIGASGFDAYSFNGWLNIPFQ
jgi:outer membrane autotransporter protein